MPDINSSDPAFEDLEPDGICPKCGGPMFISQMDSIDQPEAMKCIDRRCNSSIFYDKGSDRSIFDD